MPNYASKRPRKAVKPPPKTPGMRVLNAAVERVSAEPGTTSQPPKRSERTTAVMRKLLSEFKGNLDELKRTTSGQRLSAPETKAAPRSAANDSRASGRAPARAAAPVQSTRVPLPSAGQKQPIAKQALPYVTKADKEAARHLTERTQPSLTPRAPKAVTEAKSVRVSRATPEAKSVRVSRSASEDKLAQRRGTPAVARTASHKARVGSVDGDRQARSLPSRHEVKSQRSSGPAVAEATNRHELTLRTLDTVLGEARQHAQAGKAPLSRREAAAKAAAASTRKPAATAEARSRMSAALEAAHKSSRATPRSLETGSASRGSKPGQASPEHRAAVNRTSAREEARYTPPEHRNEVSARQELVRAMSTNETQHLEHGAAIGKESIQRESRLREVSSSTRSTDRMRSERMIEREGETSVARPAAQARPVGRMSSPTVSRPQKEPEKPERRRGEGGGRRELTGKLTITSSNGQRLGDGQLQLALPE